MRKLLSLLTAILFAGTMWGTEDVSSTFVDKNWNVGDGEPAWTASSITTTQLTAGKGVQVTLANIQSAGGFTLTNTTIKDIEGLDKITGVELNVSSNGTGGSISSVKVNGTSFLCSGETSYSVIKADNQTPSFTHATGDKGDIVISFASTANSKSLYTLSITVTYTTSGSTNPTITAQPQGAKYAKDAASVSALSITATPYTEGKALSYQWYSNTTNAATVDDEHKINAATNATYTPSVASAGTTYYYCVVSEQDGGSATSSVAAVVVKAPQTIAQIMPSSSSEGDEFLLNDVTVTYAKNNYVYVKDATGYILIVNSIAGAENGKILTGLWGKAKTYSGLPEISTVTIAPTVNAGEAVAAEELTAYPTSSDLNKYVVLNGLTFASAQTLSTSGDIENITGSFKTQNLTVRNHFKIAATLKAATSYQVLGIIQIYNSNYQIFPISIEEIKVPSMLVDPTALEFETIGVADPAPAALTFTITGSNLTGNLSASVTTGYDYYGISVTSGSLEKDANDEVNATITVTPTSAISASAGTKAGTITISGGGVSSQTVSLSTLVKAKYTVTWNNNGATSTDQVLDGAKPTFPATTPESCDATSTTFVGWGTQAWSGKEASPQGTVYTSANDMPAVTANVTYYAVFAKVAGTPGWIETAIGDLTSSDVFVLADASGYALNNDGGTSNAPTANAITVSAGKVTSTVTDNLKWQISGNATNGYTFYPNGTKEEWLYCSTTASSSSNNNIRVGTGDRKVFEVNGSGYLVTKDDYTKRYLSRYDDNSTPKDFRGYVNTNTNPVQPKCYKYSAGSISDYMTTCTYAVTFSNPEHGTLVVKNGGVAITSGDEFPQGTVLTVVATPTDPENYKLTALTAGGVSIISEKQFEVGTAAVEVSATFSLKPAAPISWMIGEDEITELTIYLDKEYTLPTLSNALSLTVDLASTNESVAVFNAGVLEITGVGNATISAEFDGNDTYKATTASYALNVVEKYPTGVENTESSVKAVKVLKNGVLYIEKSGKTYNAQGQVVK